MIKLFGVPLKCCCLGPLGLWTSDLGPLGLRGCQSELVSSVLIPPDDKLGLLLLLVETVGLVLGVELLAIVVVGCLGGGEKTDFVLGGGGAKVERAGM